MLRLSKLLRVRYLTVSQKRFILHKVIGDDDIPHRPYGGRHIVTMLTGDGIGPELMEHVQDIVKFANAPIDFERVEIREKTLAQDLKNAVLSVKRNGVAIKGTIEPFEPNIETGEFLNANVELRNELDLYIHLIRCKSYEGVCAKQKDVDIVVVRQNTEGEYSMLEHECKPGVIESLKIITESNTRRVAQWAFDYATTFNRKKITIVHKANIMKLSDGLFVKTVKEVSKSYPNIKCNDIIVDACSMHLVSNPHQFDMLIMPNLYGTILNNLVCGIIGGAGLTAGINYGPKYAIFEPACRTLGKKLKGLNIANPLAMLNSAVSLLYYLKRDIHARIIAEAIQKTVTIDNHLTRDMGGDLCTSELIEYIKENISLLYCEKFAGYGR